MHFIQNAHITQPPPYTYILQHRLMKKIKIIIAKDGIRNFFVRNSAILRTTSLRYCGLQKLCFRGPTKIKLSHVRPQLLNLSYCPNIFVVRY
jgi:hypothetical protein